MRYLLYKILAALVVVMVPLTAFCISDNILIRMPDFYSYEFNKVEAAKNLELSGIKDSELGDVFSDYMMGKETTLNITTEYQGSEQNIFSLQDQAAAENVRTFMNHTLVCAGLMILATAGIYFLILKKAYKEELRRIFRISGIVFGLMLILFLAVLLVPELRALLQSWMFAGGLDPEGTLIRLIDDGFVRDFTAFRTVISSISMVVMGIITWSLTKPRLMFG